MNRHIWQGWAEYLHMWGLGELAATVIESVGPLNFLGAQLLYFCQPFIRPFLPADQVESFAKMLEQPEGSQIFVALLRDEVVE
ncbi:MAG: hypothetical protein AB1345_05215 [Chloroflexota bacterium]